VSLTVFGPTSAHVKSEISMVKNSIPQSSIEPLSISIATIEASPFASNCTIISVHVIVGGVSSPIKPCKGVVLKMGSISVPLYSKILTK